MTQYLTVKDKFNRILDQILIFQGYFPLWGFLVILWSNINIMRTKAQNVIFWVGMLDTMIAGIVIMTLIMILFDTYCKGSEKEGKIKIKYANSKQPIYVLKTLCVGVSVILAASLMLLTKNYISYQPLINTFHQYFTFWLFGSMLTAWVDFKPVITTAQRIAKKMNLY